MFEPPPTAPSGARACTDCGRLQSYPAPACRGCGGGRFASCTPPFSAEVYSQTVISRAPSPALQAEAPYTAVLVRGARGGLLLLRWHGGAPPGIGAQVAGGGQAGLLVGV